jgi:LysM repeat protein
MDVVHHLVRPRLRSTTASTRTRQRLPKAVVCASLADATRQPQSKPNTLPEDTMGLFDFAKDVGKKLFGNDAEAGEKIKAEIEQDNPGIKGLTVNYDHGVVSLTGEAESPEAMEKAVLMAGNVKGVEEVKVDQLAAPPQTAEVDFYVIEKGDTLSAIAKKYYGNANAYPRIFEANREVIKDANLIYPGQKIRIPKSAG